MEERWMSKRRGGGRIGKIGEHRNRGGGEGRERKRL